CHAQPVDPGQVTRLRGEQGVDVRGPGHRRAATRPGAARDGNAPAGLQVGDDHAVGAGARVRQESLRHPAPVRAEVYVLARGDVVHARVEQQAGGAGTPDHGELAFRVEEVDPA